jgi:hypothetical protein
MVSETPAKWATGKTTACSLMQPLAFAIMAHPFGNTCKDWEHGVPMDCGPNWLQEALLAAIKHGPHPMA